MFFKGLSTAYAVQVLSIRTMHKVLYKLTTQGMIMCFGVNMLYFLDID